MAQSDANEDYTLICGDPDCQWCRPSPEELVEYGWRDETAAFLAAQSAGRGDAATDISDGPPDQSPDPIGPE